jgi:hypothetical protein
MCIPRCIVTQRKITFIQFWVIYPGLGSTGLKEAESQRLVLGAFDELEVVRLHLKWTLLILKPNKTKLMVIAKQVSVTASVLGMNSVCTRFES